MSLSALLSTLLTLEIINDSAVMKGFFYVTFSYLGHWKEGRMWTIHVNCHFRIYSLIEDIIAGKARWCLYLPLHSCHPSDCGGVIAHFHKKFEKTLEIWILDLVGDLYFSVPSLNHARLKKFGIQACIMHQWLCASIKLKLELDKTCKTPAVQPSKGRISTELSTESVCVKSRNTVHPCEENI